MARADALASDRFSSTARSDSNWPVWKPANSISGFDEVALAASTAVSAASPAGGVAIVLSGCVETCVQIRPFRVPIYEPIAPWGFLSIWTGPTRPCRRCSGFCKSCSAACNFLGKLRLSGQESLVTQLGITAAIRAQFELGAWRKPCDSTSNRLSKRRGTMHLKMLLEGPLLTR